VACLAHVGGARLTVALIEGTVEAAVLDGGGDLDLALVHSAARQTDQGEARRGTGNARRWRGVRQLALCSHRGRGADREAVRAGGHHAAGRRGRGAEDPGDLHRLGGAGRGARRGRLPQGSRHRDLRAGGLGQDHPRPPRLRRGAEGGRHRGFHRRRARPRRDLRAKAGVKPEDLLVSQPDTGEQALEIAEQLVRTNAIDLVVIDSVAALVPKAEIEGEMGDAHMGLQARLMSQSLRS
jgi:hypothetical protein